MVGAWGPFGIGKGLCTDVAFDCEQPNFKALAVVLFPWNCLFIFSAHPHLPSQGDVYIYFVVLVCVIIRKVKRSHYDRVRKTLIAKLLMGFHRA